MCALSKEHKLAQFLQAPQNCFIVNFLATYFSHCHTYKIVVDVKYYKLDLIFSSVKSVRFITSSLEEIVTDFYIVSQIKTAQESLWAE